MEAKLKGIMVADICGFSQLVQQDEGRTLAELVELRDAIIMPIVKQFGGTVANRAGDGVLAIFDTALGSLQCAETLLEKSAAFAPRFEWRVGLHLADIFQEGDTVHGHGVNLAARIESFADPGGIVLTQPVVDAIGSNAGHRFRKLGRRRLKNISPPVHLYALDHTQNYKSFLTGSRLGLGFAAAVFLVAGAIFMGQRTSSTAPNVAQISEPAPTERPLPAVAVLPFTNLSESISNTGFERAIAGEIITDLTRFTGLKVFALSSMSRFQDSDLESIRALVGADYVVSGTIQREADLIRIGVELAETETSRVLWAKRFEATPDKAFAVQLDIAKQVVTVVGPVGKGTGMLGEREWQRAAKTKPQDLRAYDHFLLGRAKEASGDATAARHAYETALTLDPDYGRASARIAWIHANSFWSGQEGKQALNLARNASEQAIALAPFDNEVLRVHGAVLLLSGQQKAGIETLEKAAKLNPGDADTLMWYGWGLTYVGRSTEALKLMTEAKSRNPYPPGWYDWDLAWAHFFAEEPEAAVNLLSHRAKRSPNDFFLLAAAQARLGLIEDMEQTSAAFRDAYPDMGWSAMVHAQPFARHEDKAVLERALTMTSIPK